ncbi:MAG: sodium or proton dependent glutamate transport protein [uncultured bacterium]|nr:MAG: sodium or proton dependent glutamate transport protein [uncultured bacterium]
MIKLLKKYNTQLILISVVLSVVLGIYTPDLFISIKFLGDIFLNLLKLFALPLIASTLIVTLGSMEKSLNNLKALVRGTASYMLLSEVIAVAIALTLFNLFAVGKGVDSSLILQGSQYTASDAHSLSIANFLLNIFPQNIFDSLAKFDLLPVVIFSAMFGIGCAIVGEKSQAVIKLCAAMRDVSNTCLHGVMLVSPVGIFALVGAGIAASSASGGLENSFTALIAFVSILVVGLVIHALWQLIFAVVSSKQSPWKILKNSVPVFSTAFATSSSVATLPVAMNAADSLKSDHTVTRFMLPMCASINVGGMMMYEVAAALFFSQVLGLDLSLSQQGLIALAGILGGMAEGGIPETSLVTLVVVFKIVNVPLNAISILLPLDRIIDRFRTMVNIFGNMCGAIIVSQFLKKKDLKQNQL